MTKKHVNIVLRVSAENRIISTFKNSATSVRQDMFFNLLKKMENLKDLNVSKMKVLPVQLLKALLLKVQPLKVQLLLPLKAQPQNQQNLLLQPLLQVEIMVVIIVKLVNAINRKIINIITNVTNVSMDINSN